MSLVVLHEAAERRREVRREFRKAVEALPPGGVEAAWDADVLTVGLVEEAARWRHHKGLEP